MKARWLLGSSIVVAATSGVASAAQPSPTAFMTAASCPHCIAGPISQLRLPFSGVEAWSAKLFNPETHAIIPVTLTGDGSVVDREKLRQADYAARLVRYGKLSPGLGAALETLAESDNVKVVIWTNTQIQFPPRETLIRVGGAAQAFQATASSAYSAAASPIASWMNSKGISAFSISTSSPTLHARLAKGQIAALASLDAVLRIGAEELPVPLQADPQLPFSCDKPCVPNCGGACPSFPASCTSNATWEWWRVINMNAARQIAPQSLVFNKICMYDEGAPRDSTWLNLGAVRFPNQFSSHSQAVAGIMSNTLISSITNATIVSTAADNRSLTGAGSFEYCMSHGDTPIVNVSMRFYGFNYSGEDPSETESDFYTDFLSKMYPYPLYVFAAGNGAGDPEHVPTPWVSNRGYNSLNVGASDDKGTTTPDDDTISDRSSWVNPPKNHGDFELPHMVAPGVGIASADMTMAPDYVPNVYDSNHEVIPGTCPADLNGTSFAAPQVSGVASLVFNSDPYGSPGSFLGAPMMLKAVLMATTSTNVPDTYWEGVPYVYYPNDGFLPHVFGNDLGRFRHLDNHDRKDGVGILDARAAVLLGKPQYFAEPGGPPAPRGRWAGNISLTDGTPDFDPNTRYLYNQWNLLAEHTGWMKVVVAWEGTPLGCNYNSGTQHGGETFPRYCLSNQIDVDLDLAVFDSSGRDVCSSMSWDSSWEGCNFLVTQGERFVVRLSVAQVFNSRTAVGLAWDNHLVPSYGVSATPRLGIVALGVCLLAIGTIGAGRRRMIKGSVLFMLCICFGSLSCKENHPLPGLSRSDASVDIEGGTEAIRPTSAADGADSILFANDVAATYPLEAGRDLAVVEVPSRNDDVDSNIIDASRPSCRGSSLVGTPEEIAQTPRAQYDIEIAALHLDNDLLVARQGTYDRILADVTAIRKTNSAIASTGMLLPAYISLGYTYSSGHSLTLSIDRATYQEMQAGIYTDWDCLNNHYVLVGLDYTDVAGRPDYNVPGVLAVDVHLKGVYNLDKIAALYGRLPGVSSVVLEKVGPSGAPFGASTSVMCVDRDSEGVYRYAIETTYGGEIPMYSLSCYESYSTESVARVTNSPSDGGDSQCRQWFNTFCQ